MMPIHAAPPVAWRPGAGRVRSGRAAPSPGYSRRCHASAKFVLSLTATRLLRLKRIVALYGGTAAHRSSESAVVLTSAKARVT
eukprot:CAMPEP_0206012028 /NCGR_PEP_ID=MMETSP1464-20131121/14158_1 /ASSEMBLY_ACC=CAM_ASM_001124 /TAXON_ID=119497 /ORGANISM="Exanthemachrysis gayraliae, Strain RCC1523" /LENGTH=82 /DNA_ID=CAMNT_0053385709 /DNA_START=41 /DNA_END=285 /DNA_ORIENTATION=-